MLADEIDMCTENSESHLRGWLTKAYYLDLPHPPHQINVPSHPLSTTGQPFIFSIPTKHSHKSWQLEDHTAQILACKMSKSVTWWNQE